MPKLLAFDIGTKRTGIAETDPMQIIAEGVGYVETPLLLKWLDEYLGKEKIEALIIGEPKRMHGEHSQVEGFIQETIQKILKRHPNLTIHRQDERFTSSLAQRAMIDGGMKKMKRREKGMVDQISAVIILQAYMDKKTGPSFL
ncbi:MAG: Holliday junction resolvase RuvX [Flavobacteriia bacterium]|nr:Holliday junction resolvase RuvX [Flavobacteriia bacterium]